MDIETLAKSDLRARNSGQCRASLTATVLLGTPLRADPHSNVSPTSLFRLPKLQEHTTLRQFLRRKQIISRLLPRDKGRKERSSSEDNDGKSECEVAIMIRALRTLPDPFPRRFSPPLDLPHSRPKPLRLRKLPREPIDSVLSAAPVLRRSAELLHSDSQPGTNGRKTESVTPVRACEAKQEFLRGVKVTMREQFRNRVQLNTSCPLVLPSELAAKPPKPRRKPLCDLKPSPEQLQVIHAQIWTDFAAALVDCTGAAPRSDSLYRYYVGPGNNSQLVAHLVKKRGHWTRVEDWEQADFVWTQNKQQSIVQTLERAESPQKAPRRPKALPSCKKVGRILLEAERRKTGVALVTDSAVYSNIEPQTQTTPVRIYNRLERNYQLTSKKRLFLNLRNYCDAKGIDVFSLVPVTFHIESGRKDAEFAKFVAAFQSEAISTEAKSPNLWIIKPGEGTNCGHGIHVSNDLAEIRNLVSEKFSGSGRKRTYIIQKYLERPLLIHKRKFDIRAYGLMTAFNGHVQGYFYHDGYLRTSSKEFSLKNSSRFVHLTNDAVQKKSEDYGKFESGNKLSYSDFERYLDASTEVAFYRDIWPQLKTLVTHSFEATAHCVDPHRRRHTFEVLGYDFMVDEDFKVWLIEVNTNPCLALSSAYLARLIPAMLDNAFR